LLAKLTEEEAVKAETVKCPRCGKDVGWDSLPMDMELPNPWSPLPFRLKSTPSVKDKRDEWC